MSGLARSRPTRRDSSAYSPPPGKRLRNSSGVTALWSLDCYALPTETEAFGFRDGISHPAIEGSGIPGSNPQEQPLKPGEFLLGYENERHEVSSMPRPEVLGKNGTYVVFRKLHQRVAAFRQYLKENSSTPGRGGRFWGQR